MSNLTNLLRAALVIGSVAAFAQGCAVQNGEATDGATAATEQAICRNPPCGAPPPPPAPEPPTPTCATDPSLCDYANGHACTSSAQCSSEYCGSGVCATLECNIYEPAATWSAVGSSLAAPAGLGACTGYDVGYKVGPFYQSVVVWACPAGTPVPASQADGTCNQYVSNSGTIEAINSLTIEFFEQPSACLPTLPVGAGQVLIFDWTIIGGSGICNLPNSGGGTGGCGATCGFTSSPQPVTPKAQ